ncbi:MAG TPA: NADPH-dependent F420 reductase, partial [Actinomycetota bacterium]
DVAIDGTTNDEAASATGFVAVTVPFAGQADIYRAIKGAVKPGTIVLDATSPLATAVGGRAWHVVRPWHGSAAEQAKAILPGGVKVVAGFHTIAAEALNDLDHPLESDVLVCGSDPEAKATAGALIEDIPTLRWVDVGDLSMARIAETLTALLVSVNRTYKVHDSGFRIVGRDAWGAPPR